MFELEFKTDNAIFDVDTSPGSRIHATAEYEVARILKNVAGKIVAGNYDGKIFDYTGNSVGHFYFEPPENEDKDEA